MSDLVVGEWWTAFMDAYRLAKGKRRAELEGDWRRAGWSDDRGLHPYSEAWGRMLALERVEPWLGELRSAGFDVHPVTMRQVAERDAHDEFVAKVRGAAEASVG